jgi:hypothetical protein
MRMILSAGLLVLSSGALPPEGGNFVFPIFEVGICSDPGRDKSEHRMLNKN